MLPLYITGQWVAVVALICELLHCSANVASLTDVRCYFEIVSVDVCKNINKQNSCKDTKIREYVFRQCILPWISIMNRLFQVYPIVDHRIITQTHTHTHTLACLQ